mgnify:FL=1
MYPSNRHLQICHQSVTSFFALQWYNFLLVILCTTYGYMTRKVRSDYRETRYISFAMFTVFLIWSTGFFIVAAVVWVFLIHMMICLDLLYNVQGY